MFCRYAYMCYLMFYRKKMHDLIYLHCGNHLVFNLVYFELYKLILVLSSRHVLDCGFLHFLHKFTC